MATEQKWYTDYQEVIDFAGILHEADVFADIGDLLYYFEKPYKYSSEYSAWKRHGEPRDYSEAGWLGFVDAILL